MADVPETNPAPPTAASASRLRRRRIVRALVVVDLVVLAAIIAAWALMRGDERGNVVNEGLRGSLPPAGQSWPDELAAVTAIEPPLPSRDELAPGSPAMIVATCAQCRSGDVIGGFLGRLGGDDLPEGSSVHVVAWGGDVDAWVARWGIDAERIAVHDANPAAATRAARRTFGIGPVDGAEESGMAFLFDPAGAWRATYAVGQLDRGDIAHDLAALSSE